MTGSGLEVTGETPSRAHGPKCRKGRDIRLTAVLYRKRSPWRNRAHATDGVCQTNGVAALFTPETVATGSATASNNQPVTVSMFAAGRLFQVRLQPHIFGNGAVSLQAGFSEDTLIVGGTGTGGSYERTKEMTATEILAASYSSRREGGATTPLTNGHATLRVPNISMDGVYYLDIAQRVLGHRAKR